MNNVLFFVKNYFRMFLTKLLRRQKNSGNSVAVFAMLLSLTFVVSFAFLAYTTIETALKAGMPSLALSSFATTILMFTFMLVVTESSSTSKHTDEEMLLSLPFTKRQIICAKVLYYLIFDFVLVGLLVLPSYIIYYFLVETSFMLVIRALYVILSSTVLATSLARLISVFFIRITKSFRYSDIIKSTLSVILMVGFVIFYVFFSYVSNDVSKAGEIYEFYPIVLITSFIESSNFESFIIITLICYSLFIISILLKSYYMGKTLSTYRSKNKELLFKEQSVGKSLFKRELNKYFSIPIYVSNTIFGPLFVILVALVIMFVGKDYFIDIIEAVLASGYESGIAPSDVMNNINKYFDFGLIALMSMLISVMPTTAASISLENKELWILKAHPISYKDVFISKILVNMTITLIPSLIAIVLLINKIEWIYLLFGIIFIILVSIFTSIIGLYSNLMYPKFNWESEQEVIKQGVSSLVAMTMNLIVTLIPLVLYFIMPGIEFIKLLFVVLISLVITIILIFVLFTKGKKLYEKL